VDIIRKVRVLAAERSVSISRLVGETLERLVGDEECYRAAEREALLQLQKGFHLGGGSLPSRDELYDC
jgi:hypothetical protein